VKACANLQQLYTTVAKNRDAYKNKWAVANQYADEAKKLYEKDSLISLEYHQLGNGKWNHMMDQTHIGYRIWQQPNRQTMPAVNYVPKDSVIAKIEIGLRDEMLAKIPAEAKGNIFFERENYGVSIEASDFTKAVNTNAVTWKVLPDHGRTGDAITTFPVTAPVQTLSATSPHLQYEFYSYSKDSVKLRLYFSPTLNFHAAENGLQFAVSIDDEQPQVISLNKEDNTGVWNQWMINNIIMKTSSHYLANNGKHTIKYWMINSGIVLQKIVADFGGVKQSYLGPPETRMIK
jgi:hypothetical protein